MVCMPVSDDGSIHGTDRIDVKITRRAIKASRARSHKVFWADHSSTYVTGKMAAPTFLFASAPLSSSVRIKYMAHATRLKIFIAIAMTAGFSACVTASGPGGAPAPVAHVEKDKLYSGEWHEIAYRPTWLTKGCVAGITRYAPTDNPTQVGVRDSCRKATINGEEKAVKGTGQLLDPGTNARIRVTYFPLFSRETEIAALAPDYTWFITVTPNMGEANIFSRNSQLSPELKADLTARVKDLGYDVSKLYFPPQPDR